MFQRFILMTNDRRKRRYWRDVAAYGDAVPGPFRALGEDPEAVITASGDECMAFERWRESVGLPTPPLTLVDREDTRPKARAFAQRLLRGLAGVYADQVTRKLLLENDAQLCIEPDPEDEDLWHCRIGDAGFTWTGKTPMQALQAAFDDMIESMIVGSASAASSEGAQTEPG
jgi:hypothetical protein